MKPVVHIMWFRRDLRLSDNAALYHALRGGRPVVPVFIFDRNILDQLEERADRRVTFICQALQELQAALATMGSSLEVMHGDPAEVFHGLMERYQVEAVYANHDYEQYAIDRDAQISQLLNARGVGFHTYKDQVIFEKDEILKDDGRPYTVFTPYSKKWKAGFSARDYRPYSTAKYFGHLFQQPVSVIPPPEALGFVTTPGSFPGREVATELLRNYEKQRDYPGLDGTSRLSVHLRFGTVSIREIVRSAVAYSETFLNELIWRDFYQMITWQVPAVRKGLACKPAYDRIEWRNNEAEFGAWCKGATGFPLVDAGMRELNATGLMHNRLRMITASFLCKHLLIDWRWGESYFASRLLDYDFAANNGGWQWVAGSGCDAAPYFRIFSPAAQAEKFDRQQRYTRKWVPEMDSADYPPPIVDHDMARRRCLDTYARALRQG